MERLGLTLAALAFSASAAMAQTAPKGDGVHGKKIFVTYGCYQCHGYQGQGTNAGNRLAPKPLPFAVVDHQLREPRGRMPAYTRKTVSDQDVADIYAYLASTPKAKTVDEIPLLAAVR